MSQSMVSVCVVYRNTRKYFEEAIESILAQRYPHWELLLVDDGSTDGTDTLARAYAERDERIRALHHPGRANLGISASRNLALAEARGEFVAQVDSDDVVLPDHLAHQLAVLRAHPDVALVYGPVERWYSWTEKAADAERDFVARPLRRYNAVLPPPALLPIMLQRQFGVPLGFVARREAMLDVGGYENEFRGLFDDQVFFAKLALRHRVYATDRCTYRYRRHRTSITWSSADSGERLPHRMRFLAWLRRYLSVHDVRDWRVRLAVRQEVWKGSHPEFERRRIDLTRRVRARLARMGRQLLPIRPS